MGRKQEQEEKQGQKQQSKSLRSKAAHFVSDLTTVLLNPISDKPSRPPPPPSSHLKEKLTVSSGVKNLVKEVSRSREGVVREISEKGTTFRHKLECSYGGFSQLDDLSNSEDSQSDAESSKDSVDGPDTSSFTAFLYSLLASSESGNEKIESHEHEPSSEPIVTKENAKKKSLFSRGKQSLGKAFYQAAKLGGFRYQAPKASSNMAVGNGNNSKSSVDEGISMQTLNKSLSSENLPETENLPEISEPSLLLSEKTRSALYNSLPAIVQGRKWMLLYSTWRHGISLSTLYRRSMIWPGPSLLVVGDRNGAVFGGLVEAPLRPTNRRRYQGSNNSFVFTNNSGQPLIFRPTGVNRYFTVCSTEYLAMGGGGHFALYLDSDLLIGSSSSSETYGNPCLARSQDFEVKEVELWGFVYASRFEEMVTLSRTEIPGICSLLE